MIALFILISGFVAILESADVTDFSLISGNQTPDGRLNFTYLYDETASAAEKVENYLELLKNETASYADELLNKSACSSEMCKQVVVNCVASIPENCAKPLQDKVIEKLVKIQELEGNLRTNANLCFSLRVTPPPSCELAKQNILKNLASVVSEQEMLKLDSLLKTAITCVTSYLNTCVKNK